MCVCVHVDACMHVAVRQAAGARYGLKATVPRQALARHLEAIWRHEHRRLRQTGTPERPAGRQPPPAPALASSDADASSSSSSDEDGRGEGGTRGLGRHRRAGRRPAGLHSARTQGSADSDASASGAADAADADADVAGRVRAFLRQEPTLLHAILTYEVVSTARPAPTNLHTHTHTCTYATTPLLR
jgi:hypothetical protein